MAREVGSVILRQLRVRGQIGMRGLVMGLMVRMMGVMVGRSGWPVRWWLWHSIVHRRAV